MYNVFAASLDLLCLYNLEPSVHPEPSVQSSYSTRCEFWLCCAPATHHPGWVSSDQEHRSVRTAKTKQAQTTMAGSPLGVRLPLPELDQRMRALLRRSLALSSAMEGTIGLFWPGL